ncbi:MAG: HTH-type transcriptional regulator Lrs14 [Sulfolobaceae archaeon]
MESGSEKIKLPSGKEMALIDALNFCYDLSDTDFQILKILVNSGTKTEDELAEILKLSKASINRSVNKLIAVGFVERVKDTKTKGGRPRYLYKSISVDKLIEKISKDFNYCAEVFSNLVQKVFKQEMERR